MNVEYVTLGGCVSVRYVLDPVKAVLETADMTLLHSTNSYYPLLDMMYKQDSSHIIINACVGEMHACKPHQLTSVGDQLLLKDKDKIDVYYFVPSEKFKKFTTTPVDPVSKVRSKWKGRIAVHVIAVPDPAKE